jgi:hypothetical protein
MTKIVVSGIKPYEGSYELDDDRAFSTREWRWIKQISGYMPLTVADGFKGGDPDLFIALAVIAMNREGRIDRDAALEVAETLADVPFDGASITFDVGEATDDAPLPETSGPDASSKSGSLDSRRTSGPSLTNGSEVSDATPERTSVTRLHTSPI